MRMRLLPAGAEDPGQRLRAGGRRQARKRNRGDRVTYKDSWNIEPMRLGSILEAMGSH